MKGALVLILLCVNFSLIADSWDNLTVKQAKQVKKYLTKHPIILDYCDCCSRPQVFLMRVISSEIIPCSWSKEQKSVSVVAKRIGQLEVNTYPSIYRVSNMADTVAYTISMNYTFVYTKKGKWAVPFFKTVPYNQNSVCAGATNFPNPNDNEGIKDVFYMDWYRKFVATE